MKKKAHRATIWRRVEDKKDPRPFKQHVVIEHSDIPETIDHPPHYNEHPSGVECIVVAEHFNFCLGNALKYIWRAALKGKALEDLKKARWYIDREISRRELPGK